MQNVAIFCGGVSAEHEVSIRSARNIVNSLDKTKFNPLLVTISRAGTWYLQNDLSIIDKITDCAEPFQYGELCTLMRKASGACLITLTGQKINVDVAFPMMHGPMGEDGTFQGLFEVMNLAYVGSGILSSAAGMDKDFMKRVLTVANLPVSPSVCLHDKNNYPDYETVSKDLDSTILFIKPCMMGSSVGVSKVKSAADYDAAIAEAFKYCSKILVEKFISGREFECAVLGNKNPKASVCIGEVKANHDFLSYEAKYLDPNGATRTIPANIDPYNLERIRDTAVKAYVAMDCKGLARVDFFLSDDNEIFINELNTLPGFTSISMYPKLFAFSGINTVDLISQLIDFALEEHQQRQEICLMPSI